MFGEIKISGFLKTYSLTILSFQMLDRRLHVEKGKKKKKIKKPVAN